MIRNESPTYTLVMQILLYIVFSMLLIAEDTSSCVKLYNKCCQAWLLSLRKLEHWSKLKVESLNYYNYFHYD